MTITGPDARSAAPGQAVVDAAMLVLERMGLTPADLLAAPAARPAAPTFAEYIPVVSALVSDGCRRAYGSYWNRVTEQWGSRRIDEPTPSEIRQLVQHVRANVVPRRNSRGGRSAAEHLIAALRCMYKHAEEDGLIDPADNPARKVDKPRRLPSTRRAVADKRLAEINHAAATTGDDPELDTLLLRLHTETACRRGGALALRPQDLDPEQCLILLREKGETVRWQPVSPTLMAALLGHAGERHAPPDGQLLRYRNGRRITYRRYDHLWERLGRYLPWVRAQQISMHWIRHTTLTWVERNFGYAVAKAYAGHTDNGSDTGATATYVRATTHEVAAALAALTGEPHPLATQERVVTPMAALTAGVNRPGATADLGPGGPPAARTTGPAGGDRSAAVSSGTRTVRSWPLLVLAAPAAAEVWSGWVGIAQKTGFGLVSPLPGILPSLHLDTSITLPVGVEAYAAYALRAWLAGGALDQRPDPPVRQVVRDLLLRARHGRTGGLPPAGPGRDGAGTVADHHDRVLPAGPGPGHGHHPRPHAARRRRTRPRDEGTGRRPAPRPVLRGPGRAIPGPDRERRDTRRNRSSRQDSNGPAAGPPPRPEDQGTGSDRDQPGTPDRQQARSSGKASITAGLAQQGDQGFQRGPECPGARDQRRTGWHQSRCAGS